MANNLEHGFLVKVESEGELIEGVKMLNKIGALGSRISYGTYLPDSYLVSDVISKKINIPFGGLNEYDICAFSILYDTDEYRNTEFPNLFGKTHILVSLSTNNDIKMRDVPKSVVTYTKMIDETKRLMDLKNKM